MHELKSFSSVFLLVVFLSWTTQVPAAPFQEDSDEFPIIMMSAELGTHASMPAMGVDYVHTYNYPTPEFFNSAAANGLRVMVNLDGAGWAGQPDAVDHIRNLVREFKDNPALGFWYLADEPDMAGVSVSDLTQLYTAIKAETPAVLVANAEAWTAHWTAYQGAQDMLMVDQYPVTTTDPFPMQDITHPVHFLEHALAVDDEPAIPILQCFNWQVFYPDRPSRLPTAEELRYWSFASMARGARGLAWYSYYEGMRSPGGPQWFSNTFAPVMREVRQFADAVAPAHHPTQISDAEAADAYLSVWNRAGVTWVMAVNNLDTSNTVSVSLDGQVADGTLIPWGSSVDIPATISSGNLQPVTLEPYEVRVWTLGDAATLLIESVEAIDIAESSADIHFVFNQYAPGQVEYGLDTSYGQWTTKEESFHYSDHTQPIGHLTPATTYHFRVHGWDRAGIEVVSEDYQFTTYVPEPSTLALCAIALFVSAGFCRRRPARWLVGQRHFG